MGEDLIDRTGPSGEREAVDGKHDQAEVAERGKGHQAPIVALHQSQTRAVENADYGENDEQRSHGARLDGEEPDVETQHRVEAELAGNHHGECDGSFAVSVGEPTVQRKDGNLDREGEQERERDPEKRSGGKHAAGGLILQVGEIESMRARVEPQDGDEQWRGWNEGEEEELHRSFWTVLAAVHGNEDGHRHQRELPEAVVEHEIERNEDAKHGGLLDEKEGVEDFAAGLDGFPTGNDADGGEKADQHDEPEAEAVDAYVIADGGAFDPGNVDFKLEATLAGDEVCGKMKREEESDERSEERDPVG